MRRVLSIALATVIVVMPMAARTQSADDAGAKNAQQARAALDKMVQALGGQAWLNMKNVERQGHIATFFHGKPNAGTAYRCNSS